MKEGDWHSLMLLVEEEKNLDYSTPVWDEYLYLWLYGKYQTTIHNNFCIDSWPFYQPKKCSFLLALWGQIKYVCVCICLRNVNPSIFMFFLYKILYTLQYCWTPIYINILWAHCMINIHIGICNRKQQSEYSLSYLYFPTFWLHGLTFFLFSSKK